MGHKDRWAPLAPSSISIFSAVFPITSRGSPRLNLPLQFEEGLIGTVEALCQDCRDVKEPDRVYPQ
jgi:hypothetical protein